MAAPPKTPESPSKVVVACLDGRRLKGYTYDFSPARNSFHLLPQENTLRERGETLAMKDLKAIFFVKDFAGDAAYRPGPSPAAAGQGRKIEVIFPDGERFEGQTQGYNAEGLGFFVSPIDSRDNALRIFVINRKDTLVKFA
jgi:Family of unknown function (DUF6982)